MQRGSSALSDISCHVGQAHTTKERRALNLVLEFLMPRCNGLLHIAPFKKSIGTAKLKQAVFTFLQFGSKYDHLSHANIIKPSAM